MTCDSTCAAESLARGSFKLAETLRPVRKSNPLVTEWRRRSRFRADLRRLLKVGTYMIEDIGLTYEEALRESEKPIWKP